jgi:hypothetical protein
MEWAKWAVQPAVMVLEILFMISPFALYFYAAYGPTLNVLHASAWTAWLTQFFLPHVAHTHSVVLDAVPVEAGILVAGGALIFLAGPSHSTGRSSAAGGSSPVEPTQWSGTRDTWASR